MPCFLVGVLYCTCFLAFLEGLFVSGGAIPGMYVSFALDASARPIFLPPAPGLSTPLSALMRAASDPDDPGDR